MQIAAVRELVIDLGAGIFFVSDKRYYDVIWVCRQGFDEPELMTLGQPCYWILLLTLTPRPRAAPVTRYEGMMMMILEQGKWSDRLLSSRRHFLGFPAFGTLSTEGVSSLYICLKAMCCDHSWFESRRWYKPLFVILPYRLLVRLQNTFGSMTLSDKFWDMKVLVRLMARELDQIWKLLLPNVVKAPGIRFCTSGSHIILLTDQRLGKVWLMTLLT